MPSFKNRALTLATLGLLSTVPIETASLGLLQIPEVAPPPPSVERVIGGGGITRLEIPFKHIHKSELELILHGEADVRFSPTATEAFRHISRANWLLGIVGSHKFSGAYHYEGDGVFVLEGDANVRVKVNEPGAVNVVSSIRLNIGLETFLDSRKLVPPHTSTPVLTVGTETVSRFSISENIEHRQISNVILEIESDATINRSLVEVAVNHFSGRLPFAIVGRANVHYKKMDGNTRVTHTGYANIGIKSATFVTQGTRSVDIGLEEEELFAIAFALFEDD